MKSRRMAGLGRPPNNNCFKYSKIKLNNMRKISIITISLIFLAAPLISQAVYLDPISHKPIKTDGSNCILTADMTQKSATTVYTLNISLTNEINSLYYTYFHRSARCEELQFYADHATPLTRVKSWLIQTELQRYQNHFYNGTVSTYDHKAWRLINGQRQRIYDWLTMVAWGYIPDDHISIPVDLTNQFYTAYPEIGPLVYNKGPYFQQINNMWKNQVQTSNLPARLQNEVVTMGFGYYGYFLYRNPCDIGTHARGWNCNVFNFSFAYQNASVWRP